VVQTFELGIEGVRLGWQVSDSRTQRNSPVDCPQVTGDHNPRLQTHRINSRAEPGGARRRTV
jgi:hypothetical protein